jgi:hypothetical protein
LPQGPALAAYDRVVRKRTGRIFSRRSLQRYFAPARRGRLIIKDPIACLSAEWIHRNFGMPVVVVVRHPGAFTASLLRMAWRFDFAHLTEQEQLIEDVLAPLADELRVPPADEVSRAGLLWKALYLALQTFGERNPDWVFVRHEDVSETPVAQIQSLYCKLGLAFSAAVADGVREHTGGHNPADAEQGKVHTLKRNSALNVHRWQEKLTPEDIGRLRAVCAPVADAFYGADSWGGRVVREPDLAGSTGP